MIYLKGCCCGCSLAMGGKVTGWLEIVWNVIQLIPLMVIRWTDHGWDLENTFVDLNSYNNFPIIVYILHKLMTILFAAFLIYGAMKPNKKYVMPYLILQGTYLMLIGVILFSIIHLIHGQGFYYYGFAAISYGECVFLRFDPRIVKHPQIKTLCVFDLRE